MARRFSPGITGFVVLCACRFHFVSLHVFKAVDSLTEVKSYFVEISNKGSQRHNSQRKGTLPVLEIVALIHVRMGTHHAGTFPVQCQTSVLCRLCEQDEYSLGNETLCAL
jgi:hypothetical protein